MTTHVRSMRREFFILKARQHSLISTYLGLNNGQNDPYDMCINTIWSIFNINW